MINVKEGISNIHRLVQQVKRLGLKGEGKEEGVLRKAQELINSAVDIAEESPITGTGITRKFVSVSLKPV